MTVEPGYTLSRLFQRFIQTIMRFFFHALYHTMAGAYDLIASIVSVGRWTDWVGEAARFVDGERILELGFGPGHLQKHLLDSGFWVCGIDESKQMNQLARRRLARHDLPARLTRGLAQRLPFQSEIFDCVAATFPSPYITDPDTLAEIHRVLHPSGRLVVLIAVWITQKSFLHRFMAFLFRLTGQVPDDKTPLSMYHDLYQKAGFQAETHFVERSESRLMFIFARK